MVDRGDGYAGHDLDFSEVDVDVAVVGAGPAGSIAACAAARRGLRVALIDRSTFPRDKTCGDGIGPGAVRVLRDLGLDGVLAGRRRIESVSLFGPRGERSENPVPTIPGKSTDVFVVPRLELDEYLYRAAIESGARDLTGTRYIGTSQAAERARNLELRDAAGARTGLRAHLVIGADGAYSAVRKDLVVRDQPKAKFTGIAMRAYAESRDFEVCDGAGSSAGSRIEPSGEPSAGPSAGPRMLFEFSPDLLPSYGWVFPVGGGVINLGVGLPIAQLRERGADIRQLLADFVYRLREHGFEIGELRDVRSHQLPGVIGMPRLAHERAVLIGDAASMINPVSGEGIAYGMTAAQRLIAALPDDLADDATLTAALDRFERGFRSDHRLHFLSCRCTMAVLRHATTANAIVRAIQNDPRVLSGVFDMILGDGRLHADTVLAVVRRPRRAD